VANKLSIVIITKNEEKFITDAVNSSIFADEVLVLDSESTDKTCNIAKEIGARVEQQAWLGFGAQKNKAVELADNDWVFVLDADERITPELRDEIISTLKNPQFDGYRIARLNNLVNILKLVAYIQITVFAFSTEIKESLTMLPYMKVYKYKVKLTS